MPPAQVYPAVQAVQLAAVAEQVEDVVKLEKNPALQRQPKSTRHARFSCATIQPQSEEARKREMGRPPCTPNKRERERRRKKERERERET
jgi:hypothetical protein